MFYLKLLKMILSKEQNKHYKRRKYNGIIIDTVNLEEIKEAVEYLPIVGVTSNPSNR